MVNDGVGEDDAFFDPKLRGDLNGDVCMGVAGLLKRPSSSASVLSLLDMLRTLDFDLHSFSLLFARLVAALFSAESSVCSSLVS